MVEQYVPLAVNAKMEILLSAIMVPSRLMRDGMSVLNAHLDIYVQQRGLLYRLVAPTVPIVKKAAQKE